MENTLHRPVYLSVGRQLPLTEESSMMLCMCPVTSEGKILLVPLVSTFSSM